MRHRMPPKLTSGRPWPKGRPSGQLHECVGRKPRAYPPYAQISTSVRTGVLTVRSRGDLCGTFPLPEQQASSHGRVGASSAAVPGLATKRCNRVL